LVNAGLATTPTGQVKTAPASPADSVIAFGSGITCGVNGFYKIPAGKALIITGATFDNVAASPGAHAFILYAGSPASPCITNSHPLAVSDAPASENNVSQNQEFSPGIAVPAGFALALSDGNENGDAFIYGYLVPAAAVPPGILKNTGAPR
jgi:hypothetical protein